MTSTIILSGAFSALRDTAKRFSVGALTAAAGGLSGNAVKAAGGSATTTALAKGAAEVGTLTTAGAGIEGRLPHPQESVDAAFFVGGIHGVTKGINVAQDPVPKLREIYAKTGRAPKEVARLVQ